MNIHLCTNESLVAGGFEDINQCQICRRKTKQTIGFVGSLCHECGFMSADDMNVVVRQRRNYLNLSRREMAQKTMLKPSSVSKYENTWPSKSYWMATDRIVKEANANREINNG